MQHSAGLLDAGDGNKMYWKLGGTPQRGCGESVPSSADPSMDMTRNTTEHLLADMEALPRHLELDRWLLYGGSRVNTRPRSTWPAWRSCGYARTTSPATGGSKTGSYSEMPVGAKVFQDF